MRISDWSSDVCSSDLKNALRGKADRDTADTETRHQPGDIDPHIVENDDARDREQRDADEQADDAHRVAERFIMPFGGAALDQPENDLAHPDRALPHDRDGEDELDELNDPTGRLR